MIDYTATSKTTQNTDAYEDISSPEEGEIAPNNGAPSGRKRSRSGRSIQKKTGKKIHLDSGEGREKKEKMISQMSMSECSVAIPARKATWVEENESYIQYVESLYVKVTDLIKKREWKIAGKILKQYNSIKTLQDTPKRFKLLRRINDEDVYVFTEMLEMTKNVKILKGYGLVDGFQFDLIESQLHDDQYKHEFVSEFCFFVRKYLLDDRYHESNSKVMYERGNIVYRSLSLIIYHGFGGHLCNEIISNMFRAIRMLSTCDGYETERKQLQTFDKLYDENYRNCYCFSEDDILFLLGKFHGGRLGLLCMWKLLKHFSDHLPRGFTLIHLYIEAVRSMAVGYYEDKFKQIGSSLLQIKSLGIKVSDYAECHQVIINSLLSIAGRHSSGDFNMLCRTHLRTCLILVDSDYLKVLHDISERRFAEASERLVLLSKNTSSATISRFSDALSYRNDVLELTLAYCHIKTGKEKLCQDVLDKMKVRKGSLVHFQQLSLYLMLGLNDFVKKNLPHSRFIDTDIRYAFRRLAFQVDALLPGDRMENQSRHYLAENLVYWKNVSAELEPLRKQITELKDELATQKSKYGKLRDSKKKVIPGSQSDESDNTLQKMQVDLVEERSQSEVFASTIVELDKKAEGLESDNKAKAARIDVLEKEVSRLAEQERKATKLEKTTLKFYGEIEDYKAQIAKMKDEIADMKKSMELFDKPLPSLSSPRKEGLDIFPPLPELPLDLEPFDMSIEEYQTEENQMEGNLMEENLMEENQ